MKTESFIKTNIETTVQCIEVLITTECKQGEIPSVYNCNVSGQIPPVQEGEIEKWFNVNIGLNTDSREVQVSTSGNVPLGFLAALETEMLKAHEFVMAGIEAGV